MSRARLASALIAILVVCPLVRGQAVDDADHNAAEKRFPSQFNIHKSSNQFPDGARGWVRGTSYGVRNALPADASTREKLKTTLNYCASDAILLGQYMDSNPAVLTRSKGDIYTVSHFKVLQVVKGAQLTAGQVIVTYRAGGELMDEGERVRVDTPDAPPYKSGQWYLLLLEQDKTASRQQYHVADQGTTLVTGGRVYPSIPGQMGFSRGTSTANVLADFARAASSPAPSPGCAL